MQLPHDRVNKAINDRANCKIRDTLQQLHTFYPAHYPAPVPLGAWAQEDSMPGFMQVELTTGLVFGYDHPTGAMPSTGRPMEDSRAAPL